MTTKPPNKHVYFAKARAQAKAEEFRLLLIEKDKRIKVLTDALQPFADFAEHLRNTIPRGLTDELYQYHNANGVRSLRLSDCINASAALAGDA